MSPIVGAISRMIAGIPPGGHVEVDEQPAATAHREAAEELDVDTSGRLGAAA